MDAYDFTSRTRAMEAKLYRTAKAMLRLDADCADAIGEAVLKAWQKQNTLRDETLFEPWLMRILVNACRDIQRKRIKKTVPLDEALLLPAETPFKDPDLEDAIMALNEKYRLPIVLHYLEGYPVEKAAAILALPITTVKWRLHEGRKQLKSAIEEVL